MSRSGFRHPLLEQLTRAARLAPLLLLLACLEITPPVQERLSLAFDEAGGVTVALDVAITDPSQRFQEEPAALKRIAEARWLYENGKDDWSARFASVDWDRETTFTRKEKGGLVALTRTGWLADPGALTTFLGRSGITASSTSGEGYAEFTLFPGEPLRATREQRDKMERALEAWLPSVMAYHQGLEHLYRYLGTRPDRAKACFGEVFSDNLTKEVKDSLPPVTDEEKQLVDPLGDAMGKVADLLLYKRDEAYSPEELSSLVYDPFPAPVQVSVPGDILAVEGFQSIGPRQVAYRRISLWRALSRIEEKAVAPDPLMILLPWSDLPEALTDTNEEKGHRPPLDLDALVAVPRRVVPWPSEVELRAALADALTPAPVYRVRWRPPAAPDPGGPSSSGAEIPGALP